MERESQPAHSGLTERLADDIWQVNFYRFCQLLEQENPDAPKLGSTEKLSADPVRFRPWPGMGFPVSELKAVETDEDHPGLSPTVRTTFLGMYGVDFAADGAEETASAMKWVYVARPEYQANVEVLATLPAPVKKWKSFVAGMGAMLAISVAAAGSWQYVNRPNPLQAQLAASLAPLPATLTPEQVDLLRQQTALPQNVIAQTQQQLNRLDKLPPGWSIDYSRQLVEQAQALWPEQAKSLAQQWQQQRSAAALPAEQLNGWSQGMMTLQKLSDRLNGLDEQKGKYITVSELKSVVFATMQFFNQSIPAEEQLRVLSQHPAGKPLPAAAQSQLEMHLKQLTARYAELKQQAEK